MATKTTRPTKFFSVVKSAKFYRGRKYTSPKPLLVIRHNMKTARSNPAKGVTTRKEGAEFIKKKKGINIKSTRWN